MLVNKKILTIFIFLIAFVAFVAFAILKADINPDYKNEKSPKIVVGDCNSSDPKKRFVSKTYTDVNANGKYDTLVERDCNGKVTSTVIKETVIGSSITTEYESNFDIDFVDYRLLSETYNSDLSDFARTWAIYDSTSNLIGYEIKVIGASYYTLIIIE